MGFKCPGCKQDFGDDKDLFYHHLNDCPEGRKIVIMHNINTDFGISLKPEAKILDPPDTNNLSTDE